MNKIFKYILGIIPLIIGISFCNAGYAPDCYYREEDGFMDTEGNFQLTSEDMSGSFICRNKNTCQLQNGTGFDFINDMQCTIWKDTYDFYDLYDNEPHTCTHEFWCSSDGYNGTNGINLCPACQTCQDQYTSLECQTEYNLIPIENVTANYCHINFGLIDPASCPINEGTGDINWSSLYINDTQYSANDSIRLGIPEFIAWNLTYNTGETIVEIEGYNTDTEYMDSIIAQTELGATAEDMGTLVNGLQVYLPYFFIGLIILFFVGLIRKFFRG